MAGPGDAARSVALETGYRKAARLLPDDGVDETMDLRYTSSSGPSSGLGTLEVLLDDNDPNPIWTAPTLMY